GVEGVGLGHAELFRDDSRRLGGASQGARDDTVPLAARQQLPGLPGLGTAGLVERDVGLALDPAGAVPVCFTVSHQVQVGHRCSAFPDASARPAARAVSVSEAPPSILTVALASALVSPRLMMTTGRPRRVARSTRPMPELTTRDDPPTSTASATAIR